MKTFDNMERGDKLPLATQQTCLRQFVHRFTKEHKPKWAEKPMLNGKAYPVQYASDAEWLANTLFYVTKSGELDKHYDSCLSAPTWPDNPELRK